MQEQTKIITFGKGDPNETLSALIIPILINCNDEGNQIGIEYKNGKYILFGKEHMDEGVEIFFNEIRKRFTADLYQQRQQDIEKIEKMFRQAEYINGKWLPIQENTPGYNEALQDVIKELKKE
jgi:hypothetical protein